jgi:hypothetical protein
VHGETPEKAVTIKRQHTINDILHIQTTYPDLSISDKELINRDIISLRAMTTSSLSAYLYGARTLVETIRQESKRETGQRGMQQYFQPRQTIGTNQINQPMATYTP